MAVRQDDPVVGGRHCYADPALIARANKLLAAQKSDLEITADKEELALPASERGVARLRRVRPKNRRNKTEGNARAGGMLLVDDCGDAAHSIMHGSGRKTRGVYNRIGEFAPGCWLDERQAPRSRGRLQIPTPAKTAAYQYGEKFGPVHQSPDMMMEDIYAGASGRPFAKAWPEYLQKRRSVPLGADDDFATSMRRRLEANDSFDAMAGINRFARPETGEAYSIVAQNYSGIAWGDNAPWNFHWGAVILKSGGDSITLENFANSGEDAWNYQMYGPPTKEGQTFHEQQMIRQDGDVPGYGLNPTTIRVRSSER